MIPTHLLALDTCGPETTLALCHLQAPDLLLTSQTTLPPRTAASELLPALDGMLHASHLAPMHLHSVVVVDGPGSFTGIRIGLAAAKALATALAIPLFPISRLRVLALTHAATAAALDAGRGELFFGRYDRDPAEEFLLPVDRAPSSLVICEPKLAPLLPCAILVAAPTAADAAQLALPQVLTGSPADPATLGGRYLRTELYGKPA